MDMPPEGWISLTLKEETARKLQRSGVDHPLGQSGYVEDLIAFSRLPRNDEAFIAFVNRHGGGGGY